MQHLNRTILGLSLVAVAFAQTGPLSIVNGVIDFSGAGTSTLVIKTGAALPGTCGVLEFFGRTSDNTVWYCSAVNTWTQFTAGGGGGITGLTTNTIPKATSATSIGNSTVTDDGTTVSVGGRLDIKANPFMIELPNSATGTVNNKLAKAVVSGGVIQAEIITTSAADQAAALGCVISGGGNTGTAIIMIAGTGSCYFDAATTAGHIAVPSATSAGALHDTGSASAPATGETLATIGATDACGAPPCLIAGNLFMTPDIVATGGNGNGGGGGGNGGSKQQLFRFTCASGDPSSSTVLTTGDLKCYAPNGPSTGNIKGWTIYGVAAASATCSATVDIWLAASGVPTSGNKISASAPITLTTANQAQGTSSDVSTWTKAVAASSNWNANLATVTGCVYINLSVFYQ